MTHEELKQEEARIRREQKFNREQDDMIHKNLANQNARLKMLVENYTLNREWDKIQKRFARIERLKKLNPFKGKKNVNNKPHPAV